MLTVSEAIAAILAEVARFPASRVPLADALGLVLAEPAFSDLDSPPFDKALMDGFAVRAADVIEGRARLRVIEEVMAGQVPQRTVGPGEATRIMTGTPLPDGANAVVPVEHTQSSRHTPCAAADGTRSVPATETFVTINTTPTRAGRNVLPCGASLRAGECVLPAGRQLRAQELGCLAELGNETVAVFRRPRVAVLATGDELVPVNQRPEPGQIRNSNETMLVAQLWQAGAEPVPLGIARDDSADLRERISVGLESDLLLLSGGVSAGMLDLVPGVLSELGVRQVFHKVKVKPGQPLWFGVFDSPARRCHVFGLPGNPVSSMVCCELFARTAIRRLMGIEPAEPVPLQAKLKSDHVNNNNRPTYHPAKFETTAEGAIVEPVPWIGSADLSATVAANAMALFPAGEYTLAAGAVVDLFPW